ncbi:MAG: hypothetical protein Q8O67_07355 [Deltaproteobacteria bacterium]|nr:hypothetical protein [Deltaproteobacteria bacterium]
MAISFVDCPKCKLRFNNARFPACPKCDASSRTSEHLQRRGKDDEGGGAGGKTIAIIAAAAGCGLILLGVFLLVGQRDRVTFMAAPFIFGVSALGYAAKAWSGES